MNSMTKMSEFWNSAWLDLLCLWVQQVGCKFCKFNICSFTSLNWGMKTFSKQKDLSDVKKKKNFQKVKGRDLFIHTACYSIQSNLVQHKVKHFQCLRSSFVWILHPNKRSKYSWWFYISRWIVMECLYLKVNLYQQFRQNIDINCWNAQLKA